MNDEEKELLIADAVNDYFFNIEPFIGLDFYFDEDSMLEDAIRLIKHYDFISLSMLKRLLRIGDNRAVRLFYFMKEEGMLNEIPNSFFHCHKSEINNQIDKDFRNPKKGRVIN